jgi:hypothetical protein
MTELPDLPEVTEANVTNDDLLLIYDVGAASNKSRKCTRANLLHDVVRTTGAFSVETLNATVALNAPAGAIDDLTVNTLTIGANLSKIVVATVSASIPEATTGVQVTVAMAVTGALVGDMVTLHAGSTFPAGLIIRGTVTASDVVTLYAFNATGLTIAAASHSIKALLIRAA